MTKYSDLTFIMVSIINVVSKLMSIMNRVWILIFEMVNFVNFIYT